MGGEEDTTINRKEPRWAVVPAGGRQHELGSLGVTYRRSRPLSVGVNDTERGGIERVSQEREAPGVITVVWRAGDTRSDTREDTPTPLFQLEHTRTPPTITQKCSFWLFLILIQTLDGLN